MTEPTDDQQQPAELLHETYPTGVALEDFTRLSDSLELRIGRAYWGSRGAAAFTDREVPSDITNDGVRAARAAEVLMASCLEADRPGAIVVLEMGVGLGVFARLLLRRFADLCKESGRDDYERLEYWATDFSAQNLLDIQSARTLEEFGDTVRLAQLDATKPKTLTPLGQTDSIATPGPLHAVFHNYLYDALPQSLVLRQEGIWYELRVQTRLTEPWRVEEYGRLGFEEVMSCVGRGGDEAVRALAPLYSLINVERSFFPADLGTIHFSDLVQRFTDEELQPYVDRTLGPGRNARMWVPWGAMTSALASVELLAADGFMLFTDYGPPTLPGVHSARVWQRYGAGVCINVNFPLLGRCLEEAGLRVGIAKGDDELALHARLVTKGASSLTHQSFARCFAARDFQQLQHQLDAARAAIESNPHKALEHYEAALELFPYNWFVLGEFAHAQNFKANQPALALRYADMALALNPTTNADIWCERGDALYRLGQPAEAEVAYLQGATINPRHSRSYYNLAWMESQRGAYGDALEHIGKAIACDPSGAKTESLLEKQKEILEQRRAAHLADTQRTTLRYS